MLAIMNVHFDLISIFFDVAFAVREGRERGDKTEEIAHKYLQSWAKVYHKFSGKFSYLSPPPLPLRGKYHSFYNENLRKQNNVCLLRDIYINC